MPKSKGKRNDDDSSSDSGPEDVNPPKKSKPNASSSRKEEEEEPSWLLENKKFVKVREFRGRVFIDIREYYEADGDLKPSKKGISLSTTQWKKLRDIVDEVDEVVKKRS